MTFTRSLTEATKLIKPKEPTMKLIKIAVDERVKQLTRKANTETNPMIMKIIETEIAELKAEFDALPNTKTK